MFEVAIKIKLPSISKSYEFKNKEKTKSYYLLLSTMTSIIRSKKRNSVIPMIFILEIGIFLFILHKTELNSIKM